MSNPERGRGKFKPAPDYSINDVQELLLGKIEQERRNFELSSHSIEEDALKYDNSKINILSLFSGCGGLDLGFELAGVSEVVGEITTLKKFHNRDEYEEIRNKGVFNTVFANDFFQEALDTYKRNHHNTVYLDSSDIRKIKNFPKADLVLGGFPCPGFSEAGPRLIDDERNFLYLHFIRCLIQIQPAIFVAENVKGMMTLGKGEVFRQIVEDFGAAGYRIYHKLVDAKDYGVPQTRERVILVGVRNDIDFEYEFPKPSHGKYGQPYVALKDAISDLEEKPGKYFTGSYSTIFMSRNRKKNWDNPSFTIQASGRQAPIHPGGKPMEKVGPDEWIFPDGEDAHRRLSVKEIARIQTFPDWYDFSIDHDSKVTLVNLDKVYKQIGNAVPVMLAFRVAQPIARFLNSYIKK